MPNPLYNTLNKPTPPLNSEFARLIEDAKRLQSTFKGDPQAEVQRMISSGQMTQQQFNELAQQATQIMHAFNGI